MGDQCSPISAAEFQDMREQMNQLTQQLQALQRSLRHAPNREDQHGDGEHVEGDDPAALEAETAHLQAEAARRAAAGGGGRGRGAGGGRGAGFGKFGVPNMRPQFVGRARRVPIIGAADFDGDADFDYQDDHQAGHYGNRGGHNDDRGGAPFGHFGAFHDHQFAGNNGHHDRHCGALDRRHNDDGLGKVKVNIPAFTGKENADAYYEWETKVDQIFDLYEYLAEKKAKLAAIEFKGYAITWWNQVRAEFHRVGHDHITWEDMKREMRRRFVHRLRSLYKEHKCLMFIGQGASLRNIRLTLMFVGQCAAEGHKVPYASDQSCTPAVCGFCAPFAPTLTFAAETPCAR
jgi:hypothetical protein